MKNQLAGNFLLLFYVALGLASGISGALAEGFRNSTIGTWDLGRSGGRIAQVDDATAVQNNPANLMAMTNLQAQLTPSVIYISVDYHSPSGQSASTIRPLKLLPNFFAAMPLDNGRFVAGLGVTVPYGLANQWDTTDSAFRQPTGTLTYVAPHYASLLTINFNPSMAMKLTDTISVGAGLDVMWSELKFKQALSPFLPNVAANAKGSGVGYGGNLGITWQITEKQRLAVTYRSTMTVDYNGSAKFVNFSGNPSTSFGSQIKYPNIVSIGYGIDLTDKIRVETDFEWLQFSLFKNLPINIGSQNNPLGVPSQNIPQNWRDTFTVGFGGDWKFAEHWVLRAGYQFFQTPVPDSTFSPTIPDANQNVFTIGLGWKSGHHSLEAAYGLDFYNDRIITTDQNPALNGKYTFNVHLISLAYNYSF